MSLKLVRVVLLGGGDQLAVRIVSLGYLAIRSSSTWRRKARGIGESQVVESFLGKLVSRMANLFTQFAVEEACAGGRPAEGSEKRIGIS